MAGEWDSDDPARLLELFSLNLDAYAETDARHSLAQALARLRHRLNRNSRRGSRRNIAAHYDLGNDFLRPVAGLIHDLLGRPVRPAAASLVEAQQRKYQRMLELIEPKPGDHILEIGCGWGGFAEYAARRGMRVTGLTLSQEQLYFARRRIAAARSRRPVRAALVRLPRFRRAGGPYRVNRDVRGGWPGVLAGLFLDAGALCAPRRTRRPSGHYHRRDPIRPLCGESGRVHPELYLPRRHAAHQGAPEATCPWMRGCDGAVWRVSASITRIRCRSGISVSIAVRTGWKRMATTGAFGACGVTTSPSARPDSAPARSTWCTA